MPFSLPGIYLLPRWYDHLCKAPHYFQAVPPSYLRIMYVLQPQLFGMEAFEERLPLFVQILYGFGLIGGITVGE